MLTTLHIANFAIVEELNLEFGAGMTVLTGETGAGKSILLDALGLVLGDRADSGAVRPDCERLEVTAGFALKDLRSVEEWLTERELDADGELLVRRTVAADGRSRGYINGQPAPVQLLRELGAFLVDIHGQHAHQALLRTGMQRQALDDYAGNGVLLEEIGNAYRHWKGLRDELDHLAAERADREARLDLLSYQVEELAVLELQPGELETLDEEQARLANANRLLEESQRAVERLYEAEDHSVLSALSQSLSELRELESYDSRLAAVNEMLESAAIQVKEAATELRQYVAGIELDPERLSWVEERLAAIHDLARKHRVDPVELPALLERLTGELTELKQAGNRLEGMEQEIARAEHNYRSLAERLHEQRTEAAGTLSGAVTASMQELGMPEGRFEAAVEADPDGGFSAHGTDRVEFLVTANPGQPPGPLGKIVSGGELSRISLAIQVIIAGTARTPTLIFDEVDVGVGGGVAEMVGRRLRHLGEEAQVLCVTHQPQVAAQGHHHLQVRKETDRSQTRTHVEPLFGEARVEEVARMLGGMKITEQTRSHAAEMVWGTDTA